MGESRNADRAPAGRVPPVPEPPPAAPPSAVADGLGVSLGVGVALGVGVGVGAGACAAPPPMRHDVGVGCSSARMCQSQASRIQSTDTPYVRLSHSTSCALLYA